MQPWQAAGAGQAIEDAMILSGLFAQIQDPAKIPLVLQAYTETRREKTQSAQRISAEMGGILLGDSSLLNDVDKLAKTIAGRWDEMWYFDLKAHQRKALETLEKM